MIKEGIFANGLHSYHDFDVCVKHRNINLPEKKSIRETVPYMNGFHDFSALNDDPAWGERPIEYVFDVIADNPETLEYCAGKLLDWLCNIHDADIYDDAMPNYHWHGSFNACKPTWDESGMAVELAIEFVVQPFKIANEPITLLMTAGEYVITNHGMTVAPIVVSDADAAIQIGTYVSSIAANTETQLEIDLKRGDNTVVVTGEGTVEFSYYEEVIF